MRTLWISILGHSSGRTGYVVTDGSQPYQPSDKPGFFTPASPENGIFNRFDIDDQQRISTIAATCETIKQGFMPDDFEPCDLSEFFGQINFELQDQEV